MFIQIRSPKGGNTLSQEWLKQSRIKKETLTVSVEETPRIINDIYCYKIGYCGGCGEKMYISASVAEYLFKLLFKCFNKML